MNIRAARALKSSFTVAVATAYCLILSLPLAPRAHSQEAPAPEPVCVAPEGARRPTGSAAHMYVYDCTANRWQNTYYYWDSAAGTAVRRYTPEHRFNAEQNRWEVYEWVYNAPRGSYLYEMTSTYAPVAQTTEPDTGISGTGPGSSNSLHDANGSITNTGPGSNNQIEGTDGSIDQTGPDSDNSISLDQDGSTGISVGVDANLSTDIDSSAISGDAAVLQNTNAGSATSGDALAMANIINMVQSTIGWQGLLPEVFVADIQGDHVGDILIDPSSLAATADACANCGDLTVNAVVNGTIDNDVDLLAQSGDATVSANTTAGNATSGNATAVANIVNMINSSITSGQSFIGVLNVHGNLEGDILMPEDVIDELIAANVPTVDIACGCGDLSADLDADFDISNDITATAASGNATVSGNTVAGDATSGTAETNVTVFNLTGRNVVGRDALLVFVNVAGEWIGFITDAPTGATAAMLGNDVSRNTLAGFENADFDVDTSATIRNNINVTAVTGDAEVSNNTQAGDATSGDAYAAANVSNITGSNFSLGGWFGMLFINVFGDWRGSFGTDTHYGGMAGLTPTTKPPAINQESPAVAGAQTTHLPLGRPGARGTMRAFAVSFSGGQGGGATLEAASELSPEDINQISETSFGAPQPASNYTLFIMGGILAVAYVVIFRPDWLSSLLRRN